MNNISLIGRLTATPEIRQTQSGKSVTSFRIAVDRPMAKEKTADFIDITAWGSTADFIAKYFIKGQMIALQGSLQSRTYEDKEGKKRTAWEVLADRVFFCGSKETKTPNNGYTDEAKDDYAVDEDNDDLPF